MSDQALTDQKITSTPVSALAPTITVPETSFSGTFNSHERLTKIEVENYRAYRGLFQLDLPKGENLLIYGENGAGKSSLYHTLRTFLEAPDWRIVVDKKTNKTRPLSVNDHHHRFTNQPPSIKLKFGPHSFQWTEAINDTGQSQMRQLNKSKGFLDYKALLGVHYVPMDQGSDIDLFPLVIGRLLPYYPYPYRGQSISFQSGWESLKIFVKKTWNGDASKRFKEDLDTFNDALERTVHDLGVRASAMLNSFGDEFKVEFHYEKAEFKRGPKRIEGPRILVRPAFRREQLTDYHSFFNEARLSALAICLFFAALKDSPATGLRILALDDILIGLDMTNRVKVIDLVNDHFSDWQILIFTYSKAWFERLKERIKSPGWAVEWKSIVLWEEWQDEEKSPRVVAYGSGDLLEMAERHLQRKDYTAAAVYSRKALESLFHSTCAKASLFVLHVELPKQRKVEHFLRSLEHRLKELIDDAKRSKALELFGRLEHARSFVLNQNAHFDVEEEDTLSGEVGAAITVVKELTAFLDEQSWDKVNFQSGRNISTTEQMNTQITCARALVAKGAKRQCQDAIKAAYSFFCQEYGKKLGVLMPIGADNTAPSIWKAAEEQAKIPAEVKVRLDASKPYLFGSVKVGKFDENKFEEAAKLMEELVES